MIWDGAMLAFRIQISKPLTSINWPGMAWSLAMLMQPPVCSPSRAAILTGKSPARLKLTAHIPGIGMEKYLERKKSTTRKFIDAEITDHLPLSEVTLAEVFKQNGYRTGFFGKWHLAGEGSVLTEDGIVDQKWHPQHQGFDINVGGCAYGMPRKSFYTPYRNGELSDGPKGEYLTDRLVEETIHFIDHKNKAPFFAYLSLYTIHTPLIPKKEIFNTEKNKYTAMIYSMDAALGKLLRHLKEQNLEKDTLIVFTSDNGGTKTRAPLRGHKGQVYEGGIRVPLAYHWPNHIKAGSVCNSPVACEDFFPTLFDFLNLSYDQDSSLDGRSYARLLKGEKSWKRPIYQHFPHHRTGNSFNGSSTLRIDEWKLIWWHEANNFELFNLKSDLGEKNNVAEQYPERVTSMNQQLQTWLKKVDANPPRSNPFYQTN
jgi:arylsulfatase A-like enzyme